MANSEAKSRIACDIDFDRDGRQAGYARAPLSRNNSGWGTVEIPITVVKNGSGPTVLLTGGVHGDEYEGQIAISDLARRLRPEEVQGRVIMLPAVNMPAIQSDTRLSPVDGRDINRCFPGDPRGTFSQMLAHFLDSVILPMADISVDMHTAGHSYDSTPSTNMHYLADPALRARTLAAAEAFGAPHNVVFGGVDEGSTFTSCVERRGIVSLGTELGGWGRVNIEGVRIGKRGILNVLKHMGVIEGTPETAQRGGAAGTRHMMVREADAYVMAPRTGLFEPTHYVGEEVRTGETAGWIHFVEDVDTAPLELLYRRDGIVWFGAGPGRVTRGDAVAVVMEDYNDTWPQH
ncbi:peptidase M14 [Rhodobacter sphaeroides]|jgi:Predicted deacylase|uniref:Succinylglutamatedesuccinylase/aspartoacylase n=2 Tax=Cereibacter sphaeroides TaxID=1063 RepID=Q3HKK3_CERS4|nr:succinylglutamate desuccinylase/aspartoacylase family protein [Cereibacter sphaeroides]ABA81741.1 Succinylglutamatedesuccinylase/aspartoacylase [Cereibacter sphaeroides 2.4.1]AMJ49920.1 peptidase M14 [Cereibacter sphaeroides]ANS36628.1 peptidase M14 [Cereibacter sphaeroides]ATN65693.1 peptidase M14 [Cereibacter sphaeroides]AXC63762.1 peptidase M14 [Cereibacter sphaeroides 2.4.1]